MIHPNTVRAWIKAVEERGNVWLLSSAITWNRSDDAVRWASHELRQLCPEPEFGTRTIARHLIRADIEISRSTVQRVLRESKPNKPRPKRSIPVAAGLEPHHLLTPTQSNEVWHMAMTTLRVLWLRFTVAAIIDGFTRRLVVLRVYDRTPRSVQLIALVRRTAQEHGQPHFIITDHGSQFRKRFSAVMKKLSVRHVKGKVRQPFLNGKIERIFRSFRIWWRLTLPILTVSGLRTKLDNFRGWYNEHRVHAALGVMTPNEMLTSSKLPKPIPIRSRDNHNATIQITQRACCGDPRCQSSPSLCN